MPTITNIISTSLTTGIVPPDLKTAIVKPLLKKPSLDKNLLKNYRPISNLPFLSKILEKVVLHKLLSHLQENNLSNPFQSAYRAGCSTETVLLRIVNDILSALDNDNISVLLLLDLSFPHSSVFCCCCVFLFYPMSVSTSFLFLLISFPNSSSLQHFFFLSFFFLLLHFLSFFPAFISSSSSYKGFYFLSDSLFSTLFLFYGFFISKGWKHVSAGKEKLTTYTVLDIQLFIDTLLSWQRNNSDETDFTSFPILSLNYLHFKTRHKFEQSLKLKKCTNKTYCVVIYFLNAQRKPTM